MQWKVRRDDSINKATTKSESNGKGQFPFDSPFVVCVAPDSLHRQAFYFFFCRLSMICESFCTFASIVCLSAAALGGGALAVEDSGSELLQPARKIISKESVPAKTSLLAVRKLRFMVLL